MGAGSGRSNPIANMMPPAIEIGSPKIETPRGTYKSVMTRNKPNAAKMAPETTKPLYMPTSAE